MVGIIIIIDIIIIEIWRKRQNFEVYKTCSDRNFCPHLVNIQSTRIWIYK